MRNVKCPYKEDFEYKLNEGERISFEFNTVGLMTWYKNKNGEIIRDTTMFTPKFYPSFISAYNSLKQYFNKYGLKG